MVGVPRSKGCSLCVKRRVKCDQTRPACGNCNKYGANCPGYNKSLKFITGKHAVHSQKGRRGQVRGCGTQLNLRSTSPAGTDSAPAGPAVSTTQALSPFAADVSKYGLHSQDARRPGIPLRLREDCTPFVYNMMGQLFSIHARDEVVFSAPWFTSMLHFLGRVDLLDTAMSAFMLQLVGKAKGDAEDISRSRDLYGRSLGALQKALNHPVAWKTTETLAATILCCIFELFAGTQDSLTWMLHVTGISKLVQQRGPASFSGPFDKALLRGIRPMIVTKAIFSGHDCFLDQPKWRKLSATLTLDELRGSSDVFKPAGVVSRKWVDHHDTYFVLLAQIPDVLRAGYDMREARRHGLEPDLAQVPQLEQKATRLRAEYLSWLAGAVSGDAIKLPVDVLSLDPTSPFPTVLKFRTPWEGSILISYWATLLILQECLNQYQSGTDCPFAQSNQELASNILRSLEHVGEGLMGPYRVSYAVRVAYDFVTLPLQRWTLAMISRYNEQYAALSGDVYPENPALHTQDSIDVADQVAVIHPMSWVD